MFLDAKDHGWYEPRLNGEQNNNKTEQRDIHNFNFKGVQM